MSEAAAETGQTTEETAAATETGAAATASDVTNSGENVTTPASATGADTSADVTTSVEETPVASEWPDDWRDRFARKAPATEREKLAKRLARFGSPDNVIQSYLELERRQSAGLLKTTLPENASPEEMTAYRQANGIPEEATIESYGINLPEGVAADEATKADLTGFLGKMHAKNVPPAVVQDIMGEYFAANQAAQQQLYEAAQDATINYRAEIKAEYGRDFDRNLRVGKDFLASQLGEERASSLTSTTLADGTKLGDHPEFVRLFVGAALANADDAALVTAETTGGKSVDARYQELVAMNASSDPEVRHQYWSEPIQAELQKLASARASRKAA